MNKTTYTFSPKYVFDGMRSQGWTTEACILEFIDNSIDANASHIDIRWDRDKNTKHYTLKIQDNGCGVAEKDMISCFARFGTEGEYEDENIGRFGVGATAAMVNLLTDGTATVISTNEETKETSSLPITHTIDNVMPDLKVKPLKYTGQSGTTIVIPNIKSSLNISQLKKIAGVTYFPHSERFVNNKKKRRSSKNTINNFQMFINDEKIDFVDPFYRNTNWDETDGIVRSSRTVNLGDNNTIELQVLKFMSNFDEDKLEKYKWDVRKGKGSLPRNHSGLYIRVGGRYINLGQRLFPKIYVEQSHNRIRFELNLPRKVITKFGVHTNKSKVTLDDSNPILSDLFNVIREECRYLINEMNKYIGKTIPKTAKQFEKDLNKLFNLKLSTKSFPALAKGKTGKLIEKRSSTGRDPNGNGVSPVGSGRKRTGKHVAKTITNVRWKLVSGGHNNPIFEWKKDDNGTLFITLNIDTAWGKSIPAHTGGTLVIKQMLPMCWIIYSWLKVKLEDAAVELENGDREKSAEMILDMEDCVIDQTYFLNKVLA